MIPRTTTLVCHHSLMMSGMPGLQPISMTRERTEGGKVTTADIDGVDLGAQHGMTFAVDADVIEGDIISYELPNGRIKRVTLSEVEVLQSPFPGGGDLDHTSGKYRPAPDPPATQPPQIDIPGLHPAISAASGTKFAQHHYGAAIFEAFKAVESRVQKLSGSSLIGRALMANVFSEQAPQIDVAANGTDEAQKADQREGYKLLFMGASQGLRNPRGHGSDFPVSPEEALEQLALASLLMRALDRSVQP